MSTHLAATDESILARLNIEPAALAATVPPHQLDAYIAAINWLTACEPGADRSHLVRIRARLEACYHLCAVAAWEVAGKILSTHLDPGAPGALAEQLRDWDFTHDQINLFGLLLGKLDQRMDAVCLSGLGSAYTMLAQGQRAVECHQQSRVLFQAVGDLNAAAWELFWLGVSSGYGDGNDAEAQRYFSAALQEFRSQGDVRGIARVTHNLANIAVNRAAYGEARSLYVESLALHITALNHVDRVDCAWAHQDFGRFLADQGEFRAAQKYLRQSWLLFRKLRNLHGVTWALLRLGSLMLHRGKLQSARVMLHKSLTLFRQYDACFGGVWAYHDLGRVELKANNLTLARDYFNEMLRIQQVWNQPPVLAFALDGLAQVALYQQQPERSARLFGAVEALCARLNLVLPPTLRHDQEQSQDVLHTMLDKSTLASAWAEGRAMSAEQVLAEALAKCQ
jgi:tetratricopeptide (TPR) repeat protein